MNSGVYLIHLAQPLAPGLHTCRHYCGSAEDIDARFALHLAGRGARLLEVAIERNIDFWIVRVWPCPPDDARLLEKRLKRRKQGPALCPLCANERKRQRLQLGFSWCNPMYDRLQFTLADVEPKEF
jgi:predicted GIY-YIG superfamily endonuclease